MERTANKVGGGHVTQSLLVKQQFKNDDKVCSGSSSRDARHSQFTAILGVCTFVAACSSFNFGYVITYSAPTQSGIIKDLSFSVSEYSVFGSIVTVGGLLGATLSGKLTDLLGRKLMTCAVDIIAVAGWLAIGFAKEAWSLDFGRFLSGLAVGISSYLGPIYLAELAPKNLRGELLSLAMLMTAFGMAFVYLIGYVIHWRSLALTGIFPPIAQLVAVYFIPESPRWLAKIGKEKELESALIHLRGVNSTITEEATEIKEHVSVLEHTTRDGVFDMFQKKYARVFTVGIGLMLLQQFGGINGYTFYTHAIFVSAGIPSQLGFILVAMVQILLSIVSVVLIDRYGRRPLLMVSAAGAFFGSVLTGLAFLLQGIDWFKETTPIVALISVLVYMGSYGLALGGMPWIIISEILPVNIKGSAGSLFNVVSNVCSWIVSYTFNFLLNWSSAGTFFTFAIINGWGVLFVAKLVPETKGRTLEEIQASITHVLQ